jgi:predicted transcriptional regulator
MKREQKLSKWAEGSAYNAIQDIATGFQKSQLLFTAVKYDVFTQINEGKNTVELIVANSNVNHKALEKLLNALVSINLLNKHAIYYENTPISKKHLVKTSTDYYGFLLHNADLWNSWGTLPEVVNTGTNIGIVVQRIKPRLSRTILNKLSHIS